MFNVQAKVTGNKLVLEVDLTDKGRPSRSGKTQLVGSTDGNMDVPNKDGFAFGLNVWRKLPKPK